MDRLTQQAVEAAAESQSSLNAAIQRAAEEAEEANVMLFAGVSLFDVSIISAPHLFASTAHLSFFVVIAYILARAALQKNCIVRNI